MLSPYTIGTGASELQALITVLADPEKYKKQVEELKQVSADAEEKSKVLTDERVALQGLQNDMLQLIRDSDAVVQRAAEMVEWARKITDSAIDTKVRTERESREIVDASKKLVEEQQAHVDEVLRVLDADVAVRVAKIEELDEHIVAREKQLSDVEAKLEAIRSSF